MRDDRDAILNKVQVQLMQTLIEELPAQSQANVRAAAAEMHAIAEKYGNDGYTALALVCAESHEKVRAAGDFTGKLIANKLRLHITPNEGLPN